MVKVTFLNIKMVEIGSTEFKDAFTAQPFIDATIEAGGFVKVEVL